MLQCRYGNCKEIRLCQLTQYDQYVVRVTRKQRMSNVKSDLLYLRNNREVKTFNSDPFQTS